jgi:hypothetical protein
MHSFNGFDQHVAIKGSVTELTDLVLFIRNQLPSAPCRLQAAHNPDSSFDIGLLQNELLSELLLLRQRNSNFCLLGRFHLDAPSKAIFLHGLQLHTCGLHKLVDLLKIRFELFLSLRQARIEEVLHPHLNAFAMMMNIHRHART